MELPDGWLCFILVILILLSAFFSASETALSSVNRIRIKNYADEGNRKAAKALKLTDRYDKVLSAILIGNNVVNIASASIGTVLFTRWVGSPGVGLSILIMALLVLVFGEILPKSIAKDHAERLTLGLSGALLFFTSLFSPLIFVFVWLKKLVSKKNPKAGKSPSVTEDELKVIIEEIEDEGVLKESESELLQSALEFDDITVDEILTPRVDMEAVSLHEDIQAIKDMFWEQKYSRVPIYDKGIDDIVGILNEREFLKKLMTDGENFSISDIMREPIFIHEKLRISSLLKQLQKNKAQMAIVTDQYGGVVGLVTMEDILEELVGEIYDEDEEIEQNIVKTGDNMYLVKGDYNVHDLFDFLGYKDKNFESKYNTVSGWAIETFEHLPEVGESFQFDGQIEVTVKEVDEKRILILQIEFKPKIILE